MLQHLYYPSVIAPVSSKPHPPNTKSPLIGQLTHDKASIAHHVPGRLCRVFSFLLASLLLWIRAYIMQICDGRCPGAVFSMGERRSCWCGLWAFLTLDHLHAQEPITPQSCTEGKKTKRMICFPLRKTLSSVVIKFKAGIWLTAMTCTVLLFHCLWVSVFFLCYPPSWP